MALRRETGIVMTVSEAQERVEAIKQYAPTPTPKMFPMQGGPPIPWENAEAVYADYSYLYGTDQSLERLAERGGFYYGELPVIAQRAEERRARERLR